MLHVSNSVLEEGPRWLWTHSQVLGTGEVAVDSFPGPRYWEVGVVSFPGPQYWEVGVVSFPGLQYWGGGRGLIFCG